MAQYLVEAFMPRRDSAKLPSLVVRAHESAASMCRRGIEVRYLRPILVPEDETCFHLLEAPSAEAVDELSRRVGLVYERIAEALEWTGAVNERGDSR